MKEPTRQLLSPAKPLNRKPDALSPLAPSALPPASLTVPPISPPIQARFGHNFRQIALTADQSAPLQREAAPEEALPREAEGLATVQRAEGGAESKPNQTGLPDNLKSGVENLAGVSLDDVNVHYNSAQPNEIGALAYAQGADIHVASGQEQHLPHEAWHVAQQKQGRVQPTFQMKTAGSGSGVVQLLGKAGHIIGGVLIGTVVPVLGNIIGGYIGYRIWLSKQQANNAPDVEQGEAKSHAPMDNNRVPVLEGRSVSELQTLQSVVSQVPRQSAKQKAPRSGKRTRNENDDGDRRKSDKPDELRAWIDTVGTMISASNFAEAYDALTNPANGKAFGIEVDVLEVRGLPSKSALKNMSRASERNIRLYVSGSKDWLNDAAEARNTLPMHLEEYMHQYQAMSNSFLSANTEGFKSDSDLLDIAEARGIDDDPADFDEIDVMAKLSDLGIDVEAIGYIARYPERGEFWKWWKQHGM